MMAMMTMTRMMMRGHASGAESGTDVILMEHRGNWGSGVCGMQGGQAGRFVLEISQPQTEGWGAMRCGVARQAQEAAQRGSPGKRKNASLRDHQGTWGSGVCGVHDGQAAALS